MSRRLLALLAFMPTTTLAATIHVPADEPTIQAGIDAAVAGDVVLVAAGTYFERVVMQSGVVLESESGPAATTIDGSTTSGSVIVCFGVSSATTIRGFHLKNGTGEPGLGGLYGGGIQCWSGASPLIEGNELSQNTATYGGAIGARYSSSPLIRGNDIHDNFATNEGGGVYAIDGVLVTIENNTIRNNSVSQSPTSSGGGVWVGAIGARVLNNVIHDCSAGNAGGAIWAGFDGTKFIVGNVVYSNQCANLGGALWVNDGATTIEHNTFYGNAAPSGGAIATGALGSKLVRYNILAGSTQGVGFHCTAPGGSTYLSCNDLWANAGGNAVCGIDFGDNFSADPLFCDSAAANFMLDVSSPAMPAGNSCGVLIGALGAGCGPVSVEPSTWAGVKAKYR